MIKSDYRFNRLNMSCAFAKSHTHVDSEGHIAMWGLYIPCARDKRSCDEFNIKYGNRVHKLHRKRIDFTQNHHLRCQLSTVKGTCMRIIIVVVY